MKKILMLAFLLSACAGPREYTVPIYVIIYNSDNNKIEIRLQVKADVPQAYDISPDVDATIPVSLIPKKTLRGYAEREH